LGAFYIFIWLCQLITLRFIKRHKLKARKQLSFLAFVIILLVQYIAEDYTSLFAKGEQLLLEEWGLFFPLCYKEEQMLGNTSHD